MNDALEIVQVRGKTGPYLEPSSGTASLSLLKMARDGLAADVVELVERAREKSAPVRKQGVRVREDGGVSWVDLEVAPFEAVSLGGRQYVVVFRERGAPPAPALPSRRAARPRTTARSRAPPAGARGEQGYVSAIIEQHAVTNQALAESNDELQTRPTRSSHERGAHDRQRRAEARYQE